MRISDWSSDVCSSDLGTKIVTDAGLEVPPRVESTAPERLYLHAFQTLAETALALGLEPAPVDIAAIPALRVPRITVLAIADACFELLTQDHAHFNLEMLLVHPLAQKNFLSGKS